MRSEIAAGRRRREKSLDKHFRIYPKVVWAMILWLAAPAAARAVDLYPMSASAWVACGGADLTASYRRVELNPLLGQQFGARAALLKTGIVAGNLLVQRLFLKRHPAARPATAIANFLGAGVTCGVAARNISQLYRPRD